MKKVFILLSACLSLLLFNCTNKGGKAGSSSETQNDNEIVTIPDANFKAYLLENFDANNDGEISQAEANAVKSIDCSGKEIAAIDGIEKFTNLESLACDNNNLSELELRYNKKLSHLSCKNNNVGMFIYIGMSSPLRNPNLQKPKSSTPPQQSDMTTLPLDVNKCVYDYDKTNIMLMYDE
ncbi:MAG: hypothetical protein LBR84_01955 [Tannerella sp.]|jgi:Leucine-rich repeat (LRR) protein|nr:hypothetical protein [Tannerella sp.]